MNVDYGLKVMFGAYATLVAEAKEAEEAFDSFGDDDSNWINDECNGRIAKTGDLACELVKLRSSNEIYQGSVATLRAAIAEEISNLEDIIGTFEAEYPA